jgi:hypothetical protein
MVVRQWVMVRNSKRLIPVVEISSVVVQMILAYWKRISQRKAAKCSRQKIRCTTKWADVEIWQQCTNTKKVEIPFT